MSWRTALSPAGASTTRVDRRTTPSPWRSLSWHSTSQQLHRRQAGRGVKESKPRKISTRTAQLAPNSFSQIFRATSVGYQWALAKGISMGLRRSSPVLGCRPSPRGGGKGTLAPGNWSNGSLDRYFQTLISLTSPSTISSYLEKH